MSVGVDFTKLGVALAAIIGMVVLMATGSIDAAAGLPIVTSVVGYILGNGKSVASGDRPGTLLTRADVRSRADDPPRGEQTSGLDAAPPQA